MNKFMRIVALVMVMVTLLAFAACTPNENTTGTTKPSSTPSTAPSSETTKPTEAQDPVTFRVKVVDVNGNPVAGVGVQLCLETCTIVDTNEEGWAEFKNEVENGYKANIAYLADGTEVNAEPVYFEDGVVEMTLPLQVTYRIRVVDAEGNPVEGETVTLVNEGAYAYTAATTDAEGYAVFYNMIAEGYNACFGDFSNGKLEGAELVPFDAESNDVTLTKAAG